MSDTQTATLAKWLLKYEETNRAQGSWMSIPVKAHILNNLSGTETRYSWKKADTKKTAVDAWHLFRPSDISGT